MKKLTKCLLVFGIAIATVVVGSVQAATYSVNRSFLGATLTGTVDVPVGNYVIQNAGASPFTAVNLTLTVNATSFNLSNALTGLVLGTGQFIIDATPTTLIFDTANGNGGNPSDLAFSDTFDTQANNRYGIGSNGNPAFEIAFTDAGNSGASSVTFPVTFGTIAVPEPTTLSLAAFAVLGVCCRRRRVA